MIGNTRVYTPRVRARARAVAAEQWPTDCARGVCTRYATRRRRGARCCRPESPPSRARAPRNNNIIAAAARRLPVFIFRIFFFFIFLMHARPVDAIVFLLFGSHPSRAPPSSPRKMSAERGGGSSPAGPRVHYNTKRSSAPAQS